MQTYTVVGTDSDSDMKLERAVKADDAFFCLSNILDELRTIIKYEKTSEEVNKRFDKFRDKVFEILGSRGINLDNYII